MTIADEVALISARMRELHYMHRLYKAANTPSLDPGYAAVNSQVILLVDRLKQIMPEQQAIDTLAAVVNA